VDAIISDDEDHHLKELGNSNMNNQQTNAHMENNVNHEPKKLFELLCLL
jgi:hypothetical protein